MAGLNTRNVEYFAKAVDKIVRECSQPEAPPPPFFFPSVVPLGLWDESAAIGLCTSLLLVANRLSMKVELLIAERKKKLFSSQHWWLN